MNRLLDTVNNRCGWDCVVSAFDGWRLNLSSGTAVECTKPLASFVGVSYLSLPTTFSHAAFRVASPSEQESIARLVPLDATDIVFAIDAETMASPERRTFFLVASSVEISTAEEMSQ